MALKKSSPKNPHLTGAFDLFPKSYEIFKRNLQTFAVLMVLPLAFTLVSSINAGKDKGATGFGDAVGISGVHFYNIAGAVGIAAAIGIFFYLVSVVIQTMLTVLRLESAEGKKPALGHLWKRMLYFFPRFLGLTILVGLVIIGGFILLIIPGLIMIRRYFLAPFVLVDQDVSIREAMRRSAAMSKPHSGYIWSIIGVSILLELPSVIPVVGTVISFVLASIYSIAGAVRYLELKKLA